MADPLILIDYEFHFTSGDVRTVEVQDGRDTIMRGEDRFIVERHPDSQTIECTEVTKSKLDYTVVTKRTVDPDRKQ